MCICTESVNLAILISNNLSFVLYVPFCYCFFCLLLPCIVAAVIIHFNYYFLSNLLLAGASDNFINLEHL